jgi:cardiolipin synthase
VELLIDGHATFDSIEAGLRTAETTSCSSSTYCATTAWDDGSARFSPSARAGVRVYVIYDEIGSAASAQLAVPGAAARRRRIAAFNTTQGRRNRFQLNFRNHRKVVVVDRRMAWIGGHNVGDEYLGANPKRGPWRDTHVSACTDRW